MEYNVNNNAKHNWNCSIIVQISEIIWNIEKISNCVKKTRIKM